MGAGRDRHGKPVEGSGGMIGFIVGVIVGVIVGFVAAALLVAGGDDK